MKKTKTNNNKTLGGFMKRTNEQTVADLIAIKKSILSSDCDTLWMENAVNETVCERIDSIIIELTETDGIERPALRDELQNHYDHARMKSDPIADARAAGTHDAMANALGLPTKRELVEQMCADADVPLDQRPPPFRLAHPLVIPMRIETPPNTRRHYMRELCDQFTAHVMDSFNDMAENFDNAGAYMTAALEVFIQMKNDEHEHDGDGDHEQFEDVGRNGWKIDGRGDE
jgi:hypothetical protein